MQVKNKIININRVLEYIRCNTKTISEISKGLNIPIATTHRLINDMVDANWIKKMNMKTNGHGRKSQCYLTNIKIVWFK